jgi:shikimate 5-dehydrogenase
MKIDENTKIIGRFHTVASPRGLNIYNPLFEELKINALYLLFYDPDPRKLIDGLRNLNLAGAITAGFESDTRIQKLVDRLDDSAKYVGKLGFIKNKNGVLTGYSQGGEGMYRTISQVGGFSNKRVIIIGAGNVTHSLLHFASKQKKLKTEVEIYNRTVSKAKKLAKEFKFVKNVDSLDRLLLAKGDILVNITHIGGKEKDDLFTKSIVNNYKAVVDVTFETEKTNLIKLAKKQSKKVATGWDMFTYQGQVVLETILDKNIPANILKKHVVRGLSQTVK